MATTTKTYNPTRDHAYTRSPPIPHAFTQLAHVRDIYNITHQQAAEAQPGLVALPSALVRLLLSFLPGRAIPSLLGVSHTARRLCACLHELDLSSCEKLDDVRFVSSLVSGP